MAPEDLCELDGVHYKVTPKTQVMQSDTIAICVLAHMDLVLHDPLVGMRC